MSNSPRLLYAAAVVVPLCLLLLAGWMNYQQAESEARLRVDRSTEALSEHALRTFRAHELIIDFVNSYVDGWSWERIRSSEELHRLLAHFAARHEDIASIFLLDPGGKTWMSSRRFPMPAIDGTDRDYFQALRAGDRLHISRPARGRLSQDRFFSVARRKSSPSGAFDGVIAVSVKPEYFASFYGTLLQSRDDAVGLARNDGSVLVREPPLAVEALVIPAEAAFMREIRSGRTSGTYIARSAGDQVERLHGYKQVGDYPLFASFQLSMDAVWSAWRRLAASSRASRTR